MTATPTDPAAPMLLHRWSVSHQYSGYVVTDKVDTKAVARLLVGSGDAAFAVTRDSECWHNTHGKLCTADLQLQFAPNWARASFQIPGCSLFARECAYDAAVLRTQEQHIFPDPFGNIADYVRIYFEECILGFEDKSTQVRLYPTLKLYEDGVALVQFRVLSPEAPQTIEVFVSNQVDLYRQTATAGSIPPFLLARANARAHRQSHTWRHTQRYRREARELFNCLPSAESGSVFNWTQVDLDQEAWAILAAAGIAPANLQSLAHLVRFALVDAIDELRRSRQCGWPRLGDYWSGRQSVYIDRFEPELAEGESLLPRFGLEIAKILSRSSLPRSESTAEILGPDLRSFRDYSVFINKSLNLWIAPNTPNTFEVESKGVVDSSVRDHDHFVCDKHVQSEFVEYWFMRHKFLEEEAQSTPENVVTLARREWRLANLDTYVHSVGTAGEVTDLVRAAGECLGLQDVRAATAHALKYRDAILRERLEARHRVFGILLTVLLGVAGAPALSDGLVQPFWTWLQLPKPGDSDVWQLVTFAIAGMLLIVLVLLVALVARIRFRPSAHSVD